MLEYAGRRYAGSIRPGRATGTLDDARIAAAVDAWLLAARLSTSFAYGRYAQL
jgi:hypothetical protein